MITDNRLISMVEYVIAQSLKETTHTDDFFSNLNYAKFLTTKLNLSQFIPCEFVDGKWVVLEEPTEEEKKEFGSPIASLEEQSELYHAIKRFQKAKDLVLFEGFEVESIKDYHAISYDDTKVWLSWNDRTIEEFRLIIIPTLTKQGLKQAGL